MLLVDDKPYQLTQADTDKYSGKVAIMVVESRVRESVDNRRIEAGAFSGILTHYTTMLGGKKCRVRYYENENWDDTLRRNIYEPEYIMIDGRAGGFELDNDPEKAWFFFNHPGWDEHPDRKSAEGRQPLIPRGTRKQFRIRQAMDKSVGKVFEIQKAIDKLSEASKKWTAQEMHGIAQTLSDNQSSALRLPWQVIQHNDITKEDIEALRGALVITYLQDPVYFYKTIMETRQAQLASAVLALSRGEGKVLNFDPTSLTWSLNEGKKEATKLGTIAAKDDPASALVKLALKDTAIGDKLIRASDNIKETA